MVLRQKLDVVDPGAGNAADAPVPYVDPEKITVLEKHRTLQDFWEQNRDSLYEDPEYSNRVIIIAINTSGDAAEIVECADEISDLIDLLNEKYKDVLTLTIRVMSRNLRILSEQELAMEREGK